MARYLFIGAALVSSLVQGIGAVSSSSGLDTVKRSPDSRPLFPLGKRTSDLRSRDVVRRSLHPQNQVVLSYGEESHELQKDIFVVDVTFIADETLPIVVLEEFEDLTSSITCVDDSVIVTFSDNSDFDYTKEAWGSLDTFILISNHPHSGCNPEDERGAYLVQYMHWDIISSTVKISAESLPLIDAAKEMSVDFGHISLDEFRRTLKKRQTTTEEIADDQDDEAFNFYFNETMSIKTDFAPRETLQLSLDIDGNSTDSNNATSIAISCIDCAVDGEIAVRGHFDQDMDGVEWAWVEVEATKSIATKLQLELSVNIPAMKNEWSVNLVPQITFVPFSAGGLFTIGPTFEYNLKVAVDFAATIFNITYGVEIDVPMNSVARFDLDNTNASFTRGWDQTKVTEIPFTINELQSNIDLNLNVTAQPKVGFAITFAMGAAQVGPTLDFDAPKYMLSAKQLEKVNNNCSTQISTEGIYDTAFQFSANWELGVAASLSAELDLPNPFGEIGEEISLPLYSYSGVPILSCMTLGEGSDGVGKLEAAKDVEPDISGSSRLNQGGFSMVAFVVFMVAVPMIF